MIKIIITKRRGIKKLNFQCCLWQLVFPPDWIVHLCVVRHLRYHPLHPLRLLGHRLLGRHCRHQVGNGHRLPVANKVLVVPDFSFYQKCFFQSRNLHSLNHCLNTNSCLCHQRLYCTKWVAKLNIILLCV